MSVQNVKAGRAYVEIAADRTSLGRDLRAASTQLNSFRSSVLSLGGQLTAVFSGAALGGSVLGAISSFAHAGSEIDDMSQRTGVAANVLSEYTLAVKMSDASMESLGKGFQKMQVFLVDAAKGSKENTAVLDDLGISLRSIARMTPDEQFETFADAIAEIEDPAVKTAYAMKVFGKSGVNLIPLLNNGKDGLRAFREEARELGLSMSNEDASNAAVLGDTIDMLKMSISAVYNKIGAALAPMMNRLAITFVNVTSAVTDWLNRNRTIVAVVGPALAIAGTLGATIAGLGLGFGALATTIGPVVMATLSAMASAFGAIIVPVIAIGAAVGGLTATLYGLGITWSDVAFAISTAWSRTMQSIGVSFGPLANSISSFISQFVEGFRWVYSGATQYFGAIGQALASGNLEAAGNVAMAGLRRAFRGGFNVLYGYYLDFTEMFQSKWDDWTYGLADVFVTSWASIESAFVETIGFLSDAWNIFTAGIRKTWNTSIAFIQKAWVHLSAMFMGDEDKAKRDAEIAAINSQTSEANSQVDNELLTTVGNRDVERRRRQTEIAASREAQRKLLEQERIQRQLSRAGASDELRRQADDEYQKAKQAYDDALAGVQSDFTPSNDGTKRKKFKFDPEELNLDNLLSRTEAAKNKIESKGAFSAFAARGLNSDSIDKTATNTAQTNVLLNKILQAGGARFT